jgi:hypothetical protein
LQLLAQCGVRSQRLADLIPLAQFVSVGELYSHLPVEVLAAHCCQRGVQDREQLWEFEIIPRLVIQPAAS